jgi:hypothetical protein
MLEPEQVDSRTTHWRFALGRDCQPASSQETGPFISRKQSLEGGTRGRIPELRALPRSSCFRFPPPSRSHRAEDGFRVFGWTCIAVEAHE